MVEHQFCKLAVVGSIPIGGYAVVAQLVERHLSKLDVAGSIPVYRSNLPTHHVWYRALGFLDSRSLVFRSF